MKLSYNFSTKDYKVDEVILDDGDSTRTNPWSKYSVICSEDTKACMYAVSRDFFA